MRQGSGLFPFHCTGWYFDGLFGFLRARLAFISWINRMRLTAFLSSISTTFKMRRNASFLKLRKFLFIAKVSPQVDSLVANRQCKLFGSHSLHRLGTGSFSCMKQLGSGRSFHIQGARKENVVFQMDVLVKIEFEFFERVVIRMIGWAGTSVRSEVVA